MYRFNDWGDFNLAMDIIAGLFIAMLCFLVLAALIIGISLIIKFARTGEVVGNARQNWLEGGADRLDQDDW